MNGGLKLKINKMKNNYQLVIGSPTDYNELVVYIWINDEQIAIVQKEEGVDKIRVDFFEEPISTKIYADDLISALIEAKQQLLSCK